MTTRWIVIFKCSAKLLSKSWLIGRGVIMVSSANLMALPSAAPTQIGNASIVPSCRAKTTILVSVLASSWRRSTRYSTRFCALGRSTALILRLAESGVQFAEVFRPEIFQPLFEFFGALFGDDRIVRKHRRIASKRKCNRIAGSGVDCVF